ncbi:MAG: (Fe-S)-binding protein [Pseudomonadota bacterium]
MCGICIPSCPTYKQTLDENNSPRGRISLIQALQQNKIEYTPEVKGHLDSCLQCLTCQAICPSQVQYSEIISQNREYDFKNQSVKTKIYRWFSLAYLNELLSTKILTHKKMRFVFILIINFLNHFKILAILKSLANKLKINSLLLLPDTKIVTYNDYKPDKDLTDIILFSGCASPLFNPSLVKDSIGLFNKLQIPHLYIDEQNCCGAIFNKQGNTPALLKTINKINKEYSATKLLISLNSACSAYMQATSEQRQASSIDIIAYLSTHLWDKIKPLNFSAYKNAFNSLILFHQSCSMKNQLKTQKNCLQLLSLIPEIEIKSLESQNCCGASGNYMLSHPDMAEKIASPLVQFIIQENIHCLVSSDISCSLHLKLQLEKQHHYLEVLHPVSLLYRQLEQ